MEEKKQLEYARRTIIEINRILKMPNAEYVKEYGVEVDRADRSKIEKCQTMAEALEFFMGGPEDESKKG